MNHLTKNLIANIIINAEGVEIAVAAESGGGKNLLILNKDNKEETVVINQINSLVVFC